MNPERIDVLKDNASEIVLMMSYKKQATLPSLPVSNQCQCQSCHSCQQQQQCSYASPRPCQITNKFFKQPGEGLLIGDGDDTSCRVSGANYADILAKAKVNDTMKYLMRGSWCGSTDSKDNKAISEGGGSTLNQIKTALSHNQGPAAAGYVPLVPSANACECARCKSQPGGCYPEQALDFRTLNKYREDIKASIDRMPDQRINRMRHKPSTKSTMSSMPTNTNLSGSITRPCSPCSPSSPTRQRSAQSKLVKQQYVALCIPSMAVQNDQVNPSQFHIRYYNPETGEFKKPTENEIVALPVSLIQKSEVTAATAATQQQQEPSQPSHSRGTEYSVTDKPPNSNQAPISIVKSNSANPEMIELSVDELNTIISMVREKERQSAKS